jgi:hypothetical protein
MTNTTLPIPTAQSDAIEAMDGLKMAVNALINLSDVLRDDDQEFLAEYSDIIKMDLIPLMHRMRNLIQIIERN